MTFHLGIRRKLFVLHFLAVSAAIIVMGYKGYLSQWKMSQDQIIQYRSDVSQRFLGPVSMAISGSNYANLQLPTFKDELRSVPQLLYMNVYGKSDLGTPYEITYMKKLNEIWRVYYPESFEKELKNKIKKLEEYQKNIKNDRKKTTYLLDRAKDELKQFHKNIELQKSANKKYLNMIPDNNEVINTLNWTARITIPTKNSNGGTLTILFDITELKTIREFLIKNVIIEIFTAIMIFIPILWFIGRWVVDPAEKLTSYMSQELKKINPNEIPSINKNDEIGKLAKKLRSMVVDTQTHIKHIEELNITDPLTGLYNRRFFSEIANTLINNASRSNSVLSYMYIDIDNFKTFNDTYGHNEGDIALKAVAIIIKNSIHRKDDHCFRLGGEEFLVIAITKTANDAHILAEKIRAEVYNNKIEHKYNEDYGYVTISIGICSKHFNQESQQVDTDTLLTTSDEQLYNAKQNGRNKIEHIVI